MRRFFPLAVSLVVSLVAACTATDAGDVHVDLLVVGGDEAACAAAVQAARLGVARIALVSDCSMLGGQFSAQGVGPVDERVKVDGETGTVPSRASCCNPRALMG